MHKIFVLLKLSLIAVSLLFSPCIQADVYKCVDENGKTRYQASACAGVLIPIDETQAQPVPAPFAGPVAAAAIGQGGGRHSLRSEAKKSLFKSIKPCPSTGETSGPCPGYVVDHIRPLACGGMDDPRNMQWQTVAAGKAKDRWERIGCQSAKAAPGFKLPGRHHLPYASAAAGRRVYTGPRGGRFIVTRSGRKRYLGSGRG